MKPRPVVVAILLAAVAVICASCASGAAGPDSVSGQPARHHASAQAAGPAPAAAVSRTQARTFDPYRSNGVLATAVAGRTSGRCWTTSIAAAGSTALRCQAGNSILDPCFAASRTATSVACARDPWSPVVVMRVTGSLPTDPPMGDSIRPWALELATGVRCVASTGTVPMIAGVPLDYACQDGTYASVLTPLAPVVTARVGRLGATVLTSVGVATVWRG